ncbi:hypothetical protein KIN20_006726 [Parelaphostrongylus tenuis]|uniref:Uncharacterized protein n=1 Tax=Parelaphostrongylus tenuis TaxID=148309 RepID=A0AAD5QG65_PARTN|nr:hypothetical protein KIN20_006726 [Parelaphostrongylus tenuis]
MKMTTMTNPMRRKRIQQTSFVGPTFIITPTHSFIGVTKKMAETERKGNALQTRDDSGLAVLKRSIVGSLQPASLSQFVGERVMAVETGGELSWC